MSFTINITLKKTYQHLPLIFISLYLIFAPSLNIQAYDDKRIAELLLIFLILSAIILKTGKTIIPVYSHFSGIQKTIFSALAIFLYFSAFLAADQNHAFLELSLLFGLFFTSLSIATLTLKNNKSIQLLFYISFALAALFYQVTFFTAFLASFIENIPLQWPEPFSGFSNVRFFNQYQIWSIPLIAQPLLIYPTLDRRLINSLKIIATGWASLLFASASRGAVASVVLAMLITLLVFRKHAKPFLKLNSFFLVAGFIGYLLLFKLIPSIAENKVTVGWIPVEKATSLHGRTELWQYAIQYIIENPLLGIGPMHYAYYPGPFHAHPHSSILQWACEMGIPSTLLVISLVYSGLSAWVKKFYRLSNTQKLYIPSHLWIALFCSLCSGLIYSLASGVIVMPLSQIMMTLIAGWMLGIYYQDQQAKLVNQKQQIAFMLIAGATLITLTYTVLPSLLPRLLSYDTLPYQDYPTFSPRFWQIGGIPH